MILRLRKLIGANGPLSLKASKSLKTSDLRANSDFYDQFRHEGIQSHQKTQILHTFITTQEQELSRVMTFKKHFQAYSIIEFEVWEVLGQKNLILGIDRSKRGPTNIDYITSD